jgi:hypothetical protein
LPSEFGSIGDNVSFATRRSGTIGGPEAFLPEETMIRSVFIAAGLCVLAISGPANAIGLGEAGELEHARANARAGGPLNDRDAELLERYGCLSGTNSAFCKRLSQRTRDRAHRRRYKKY